ncbi:hypothetical protein LB517_10870 [Mesorhizobium sp. BR1-1-12]|uniref:hypothetical protein n=1 Tax=unclassified Mesorhizobium TaxID=325217 RepID=UPI001CC94964|nr:MULTISPECIES: hypothetical protein [unclassified Mesorhizobium]MBZ9919085.1 hypothetical protein [Mesorhizobium sp. BR1-1-7]MBZ9970136.1 hypothetical protein [Mesorhizobium sp. BR1-1-12]
MRIRTIAHLAAIALVVVLATPSLAQQTFGGNDCTEDCSGHKAGYDWAERNQIADESACSSNSQSFNEGCQTFVEDPSRGSEEDDEGEDIED